jgi:hypothetical protein
MRRAIITVSVTLLAAVMSIVALVVDIGSPQSASVGDLRPDNASLAPSEASGDESAAAFEPSQPLVDRDPAVPERVVADYIPLVECGDEETVAKRLRERGIREVTKVYSLLFDSLDLVQHERNALLSLLVDVRVAETHTDCKQGRKIDPQVRSDQIAAIIGDTKLEQFLSLEQHLGSYAEVAFVNCVLEKHDRPMTDAERNKVLQLVIGIWERELALPRADAARGSIEYLEYRLAEIDERERLFFEQVASQLSAEQVGYLFEQYQRDSYFRADALERQRRARADENAEVLPLHFPVRSCSTPPQ